MWHKELGAAVLRGLLALPGVKPVRLAVLYVDRRELTVLIQGTPELPHRVRCGFRVGPERLSVEVLARVLESRAGRGETGASLEVLSVFTKGGRAALEGFLAQRFALTDPNEAQFQPTTRGVFYHWEDARPGKKTSEPRKRRLSRVMERARDGEAGEPGPKPRSDRKNIEKRWHDRLQAPLQGMLDVVEPPLEIVITEVSERGLRFEVAADAVEVEPGVRTDLVVSFGPYNVRARITVKTRWCSPGNEERSTRVGCEIVEVHDGVHGAQWRRFVDGARALHPIVRAGKRGEPLKPPA